MHGTPGGYDQSPEEATYRMIAPSRPGYLKTPIEVGRTPQEQADAYAALLDALGIDEKVFVMGASGGGPSAYAFAAAYPERTLGLIQLEAMSHAEVSQAETMDQDPDDDAVPLVSSAAEFGPTLSVGNQGAFVTQGRGPAALHRARPSGEFGIVKNDMLTHGPIPLCSISWFRRFAPDRTVVPSTPPARRPERLS